MYILAMQIHAVHALLDCFSGVSQSGVPWDYTHLAVPYEVGTTVLQIFMSLCSYESITKEL